MSSEMGTGKQEAGMILPKDVRQQLVKYFTPRFLAMKVMDNRGVLKVGLPLRITPTGKFRYPLKTMQRGEFFFVPAAGRSVEQTQNSVTSSVSHVRRTTGKQFFQKRLRQGIQVWRIE